MHEQQKSIVFAREIKKRVLPRTSEAYAAKAREYNTRKNVQHTFFEPIYPDYGVAKMLSEEYGLAPCTIHRYLHGKFTEKAEDFERVMEIREKARTMSNGMFINVVRDKNGELHYFRYEPRKDENVWYDPIEKYERRVFPEALLPPGANPQWEDRLPTRIQLRNYHQPR